MLSTLLFVAALSAGSDAPVVRDCLTTSQVRSTAVLDDKTILFEMRDRSVWKNSLDFGCPSLGFYEAFSYETYGSRLCDMDYIQVFENGRVGASCGLGKFERQVGSLRELNAADREMKKLARGK